MSKRKMEMVAIKKNVVSAGEYDKKLASFAGESAVYMDYKGSLVIKDEALRKIAISESLWSRHYDNDLNDFIILQFTGFNGKNLGLLDASFANGITVMDKTYRPFLQSPSQDKDNEIVFTCKKDIQKEMSQLMKLDLSDKKNELNFLPTTKDVSLKTFSARASMTTANGLATGVYLTADNFTVVKDPETVMDIDGAAYTSTLEGVISKMEGDIGHTHHDGQSYMSMIMLARIGKGIGVINYHELRYFKANWKGLDSLEDDKKLKKIFDKLEYAVQMRATGIKGMIIAIDFYTLRKKMNLDIMDGHNELSDDIHFILGEGAVKYVPNFEKYGPAELQWMAWSNSKGLSKTLSIQTLNSLNLSFEEIDKLTTRAKEMFDAVLTDRRYALEFLGAYFNLHQVEDEGAFDDKMVSKLHKAIQAGAHKERWVQKGLAKKLLGEKDKHGKYIVEGALSRAKYGELPIVGNFFFVVADPYVQLGIGSTLESGEVHFNGHADRELGLLRYPNVHESELVKKAAVNVEEYSYLRNLLIVNAKDDLLPRMAGADTDGDIILVVFDQFIIDAIKDEHLILPYGESVKKIKSRLTYNSYVQLLKSSVTVQSFIGTITNNATIWRDMELHRLNSGFNKTDKLVRRNHINNLKCSFLQGYEIDKSKTGVTVEIPEELKAQDIPKWFFNYLLEIKGREEGKLEEKYDDYDSNTAIGRNYRYFVTYEKELRQHLKSLDKNVNLKGFIPFIINHKDFDPQMSKKFYDTVAGYESNYRAKSREFIERYKEGDIDESTQQYLFNNLFTKHQALLDAIECSDITKLYMSYSITQDNDSNSDTYYRAFAFDALIEVYSALSEDVTTLVKVDDLVKKVTVKGGKIHFDGIKVEDKEEFEILKGKRSSYDTFTIGDGTFIMAEVKNDIDISSLMSKEERAIEMNLDFTGVRYYAFKDFSDEEIEQELSDSVLTINYFKYDNVARVGLYSDGRFVGMVSDKLTDYAEKNIGFQVSYIRETISRSNKDDSISYINLEFLFDSKVEEAIEIEIKEEAAAIAEGYHEPMDNNHMPSDVEDFFSNNRKVRKGTIK